MRFELEKFESVYFDLFNKALPEVKLKFSQLKVRWAKARAINPTHKQLVSEFVRLLTNLFKIFYSMVVAERRQIDSLG